jgi:hypothetical protein
MNAELAPKSGLAEKASDRLLSFLVAVLLLNIASMAAGAAPARDPFLAAIDEMKRSIAPVVCIKPNDSALVDGTAFFISRQGEFITAAHVIDDFRPGHSMHDCKMGVRFTVSSSDTKDMELHFFEVSRCAEDDVADLARCVTFDLTKEWKGQFAPVPLQIDSTRRPDGTAIAVTGFPFSSVLPITSRGYIGAYLASPAGISRMVLDHAAWPGGSGSPVYDVNRKVLGMVTQAGEGAGSGLSFAPTGGKIAEFLATHPLPPPTQDTPPQNQAVPSK